MFLRWRGSRMYEARLQVLRRPRRRCLLCFERVLQFRSQPNVSHSGCIRCLPKAARGLRTRRSRVAGGCGDRGCALRLRLRRADLFRRLRCQERWYRRRKLRLMSSCSFPLSAFVTRQIPGRSHLRSRNTAAAGHRPRGAVHQPNCGIERTRSNALLGASGANGAEERVRRSSQR